ncbi:MAG: DUF1559 domain-containing protein [Armatimonadota bacterium]
MKRFGFTLIELLVVIAIIAILAAILFPVFAKAREKARQTSCLSNSKQMGLAFNMYGQDYDERGPVAPYDFAPTYGRMSWDALLYSYVKNEQVYICPTYGKRAESGCYRRTPMGWAPLGGYGFNGDVLGRSQGELAKPSETIVISDSNCLNDPHDGRISFPGYAYPSTYMHNGVWRAHNEGANFTFADGHAKWLKDLKYYLWTVADDPETTKWPTEP